MEKLELKHLAPYLPYKLRFRSFLSKDESTYTLTSGNLNNFEYGSIRIIPILRPISDLKKNEFPLKLGTYTQDFKFTLENTEYQFIEGMLELHFDVFGLIEKGLAISYNDLSNE